MSVGSFAPSMLKEPMAHETTSQDAKVDLKALIVAVMPIYCLSETINLFFFVFYVFLTS